MQLEGGVIDKIVQCKIIIQHNGRACPDIVCDYCVIRDACHTSCQAPFNEIVDAGAKLRVKAARHILNLHNLMELLRDK